MLYFSTDPESIEFHIVFIRVFRNYSKLETLALKAYLR